MGMTTLTDAGNDENFHSRRKTLQRIKTNQPPPVSPLLKTFTKLFQVFRFNRVGYKKLSRKENLMMIFFLGHFNVIVKNNDII